MAEDQEYEPESEAEVLRNAPMARAERNGSALPAVMLKRSLGARWEQFLHDPGLCVVVRVPQSNWIAPFISTVRAVGRWDHVIDGEAVPKTLHKALSEGLERLAAGDRMVAIIARISGLPPDLEQAADMVVDIDAISPADIAKAIRMVTKRHARGLRKSLPSKLELNAAMRAVRKGSSPATCLRRLAATQPKQLLDPFVRNAPLLDDLHGYGAAMDWARRLSSDLDAWRAGQLAFSAIERNAVLAGVPGIGKSTFVRSLARTTGLPLVTSSLGQMFSSSAGYLDSIVKSIDQLFADARAHKTPCIVFIDELEGFPDRGTLGGREGSWWTPVVNHLLTLLDGALSNTSDGWIVVGATNYPGRLDPALLRFGRMDRVIWIDLPDEHALVGIYRQHLGLDLQGADLSSITLSAVGSTGAAAAGHVKTARAVARSEGRELSVQDLKNAVCTPSTLNLEDLWRACIHEAGHAVACMSLGIGTVKSVAVAGGSDSAVVRAHRAALSIIPPGTRSTLMSTRS